MTHSFHANGKLLLTAEYFVLDGATALALPVNRGQTLHINTTKRTTKNIHWQSYNLDKSLWFEGYFDPIDGKYLQGNKEAIGLKLSEIFQYIQAKKPAFLEITQASSIKTQLHFPRAWGLGTSSTLIATLAAWAGINPFDLQFAAFGGSGYDIACTAVDHPILYQKVPTIKVEKAAFSPTFKDNLYFIYLGKKQNSRTAIAHYRQSVKEAPQLIDEVTQLTQACLEATDLSTFEQILSTHEHLIAKKLHLQRAKTLYFSDFWGEVKSLGAWGGDFVLATSDRSAADTQAYFQKHGLVDFFGYEDFTIF